MYHKLSNADSVARVVALVADRLGLKQPMLVFTKEALRRAIGKRIPKSAFVGAYGEPYAAMTWFSGSAQLPDIIWLPLPTDNWLIAEELAHVCLGPCSEYEDPHLHPDFTDVKVRVLMEISSVLEKNGAKIGAKIVEH